MVKKHKYRCRNCNKIGANNFVVRFISTFSSFENGKIIKRNFEIAKCKECGELNKIPANYGTSNNKVIKWHNK